MELFGKISDQNDFSLRQLSYHEYLDNIQSEQNAFDNLQTNDKSISIETKSQMKKIEENRRYPIFYPIFHCIKSKRVRKKSMIAQRHKWNSDRKLPSRKFMLPIDIMNSSMKAPVITITRWFKKS